MRSGAASSPARQAPKRSTKVGLATDINGRNSLPLNDQSRVHSRRVAGAESKRATEGVIDSFENMDARARSEREVGGPKHPR